VNVTHRAADMLGVAGLVVAFVCWRPNLPHAGPPLISDDPHTVGPGVVQPIFAVSTFSQGEETLLRGPTADITIGLVDSLDATVVASLASVHHASESPRWTLSGLFAVGVKWEFFRRERGSLAFSPALIMDSMDARDPAGLLPLEGELTVGRGKVAIGFDIGYIPVRHDAHEWFVALYSSWAATARLNVLSELWILSFGALGAAEIGRPVGTELGTSLGVDYGIAGNAFRLLAALGTGLVSVDSPRVDVLGYLGTQYTFGSRRDRWRRTRPPRFD